MVPSAWCVVDGVQCMVYSEWCTVHGVQCMVSWCTVHGVQYMVDSAWSTSGWCTVHGVQCMQYTAPSVKIHSHHIHTTCTPEHIRDRLLSQSPLRCADCETANATYAVTAAHQNEHVAVVAVVETEPF
jgi:hypothetical protein